VVQAVRALSTGAASVPRPVAGRAAPAEVIDVAVQLLASMVRICAVSLTLVGPDPLLLTPPSLTRTRRPRSRPSTRRRSWTLPSATSAPAACQWAVGRPSRLLRRSSALSWRSATAPSASAGCSAGSPDSLRRAAAAERCCWPQRRNCGTQQRPVPASSAQPRRDPSLHRSQRRRRRRRQMRSASTRRCVILA